MNHYSPVDSSTLHFEQILLSHDVVSRGNNIIMSLNKLDKPLVVYRFSDIM